MVTSRFPIIFDFYHLSSLLGRTPAYLASVINGTIHHYREFQIPKRKGGKRTINAPYPALLECQQWINNEILRRIHVHRTSHGFCRKRSIVSNASQHLNQACLLKMDLKDFFPSINIRRVICVFQKVGYPKNIAVYLARLCCLNDCLPQGAATSPSISNIVCHRLDSRLFSLARGWELRYTRYADDLAFSGKRISMRFLEAVTAVISDEGFEVNRKKTRLCRSNGRRIVTGLSVSGSQLSVPRQYKRKLRQEIYYIQKYGMQSHSAKRKITNPFYLDSLHGKLIFWNWVEPNNRFVESALEWIRSNIYGSRLRGIDENST